MLNFARNCFADQLWRLSFGGILILGFTVASVAPYRSIIGIERLGLSELEFAALTALSAIITVAASMVIGIFTDQTRRYRNVLMGSLAVGCVGNALLFVVQTKLMFTVALIVFFPIAGTGISQFFALAKLAVNRSKDLNGDFSASAVRAAFAGAYAVTPPIWAIFILQGTDLLAIYGSTAVASLVMLLLVYLKWPNQDEEPPKKTARAGFRKAFSELTNAALAARLALVTMAGSLTSLNSTLVGLIILNDLGGNEADVGWFAGSVAFCEIPIMRLSASALKAITKPALILIGVAIFGIYLGAFQFLSSTDYLWWLIIPASVGGGIFMALVIGYVQDLVSDKPGTGGTLISLTSIGGHVFTALVFGICTSFMDYSGTAMVGAGFAVLASVLLVLLEGGRVRHGS